MARPPRIHLHGGLYHVVLRGNDGQSIFLENCDRLHFLNLLEEGVARFGHRIHGFCLMDSHVHLAVQVANTPLSQIIQNVSFRHIRRFNLRHRRCGHLFHGRYRAILMEDSVYFLDLIRYIHLNPVRAGLVHRSGQYRWSSYRAYLGEETLPWLSCNHLLGLLCANRHAATQAFEAYVAQEPEGGRPALAGGHNRDGVLGPDAFLARLPVPIAQASSRELSIAEVVNVGERYTGVTLREMSAPGQRPFIATARAMVAGLARDLRVCPPTTVAAFLGRRAPGLSVAVGR